MITVTLTHYGMPVAGVHVVSWKLVGGGEWRHVLTDDFDDTMNVHRVALNNVWNAKTVVPGSVHICTVIPGHANDAFIDLHTAATTNPQSVVDACTHRYALIQGCVNLCGRKPEESELELTVE